MAATLKNETVIDKNANGHWQYEYTVPGRIILQCVHVNHHQLINNLKEQIDN